ncbi:MAG: P-loop NTPase [Candidatus Aenigmarchaeota archaeon]|nr:P-loop NTPase [Candidatus Aenigmarchaeota archaeon]
MKKSRIISIMSGKGGVGKTVSAINIALALKEMNKDAVVIDADITTANIGIQLGFKNFPISLQDVLKKNKNLLSAVNIHKSGLKVIPASISLSKINSNISKLKKLIEKSDGDLFIIDPPPGLTTATTNIIKMSDEIIIITNPELPSVINSLKTMKLAKKLNKKVLGVVVTRSEKNFSRELKPAEIESVFGCPILAEIPEDKSIKKSIFDGMPVIKNSPYSHSSIEYRKLAAKIIGDTYKQPKLLALRRVFSR